MFEDLIDKPCSPQFAPKLPDNHESPLLLPGKPEQRRRKCITREGDKFLRGRQDVSVCDLTLKAALERASRFGGRLDPESSVR